MSETRRDQDHAQTLRAIAARARSLVADLRRANSPVTADEFEADIEAYEAGAASLERACATCRHYTKLAEVPWEPNRPSSGWCVKIQEAFDRVLLVPPDFGCTLYQPQEPTK